MAVGRKSKRAGKGLLHVYERLLSAYGPQRWWPGDSPFEVMVGAILTQAASWANVKKAIDSLKAADALSPRAIREKPEEELAQLIYSSGYYNAKARKLKALAEYLGRRYADDIDAMAEREPASLREELLEVHGIGEETADDILLYALGKPVFVIDEYTRRTFVRLGLAPERGPYSDYQALFATSLSPDPELYAEYHALIVRHGHSVCRKRPLCRGCCLLEICPTGQEDVRSTDIGD
jgi:endonuclease-3 related protein